MGIYVGDQEVIPTYRHAVLQPGGSVARWENRPFAEVYVGDALIWPSYREAYYRYAWNTPESYLLSDNRRWDVNPPEWAITVDYFLQTWGYRGEDGARGIQANHGEGGRAFLPNAGTTTIQDQTMRTLGLYLRNDPPVQGVGMSTTFDWGMSGVDSNPMRAGTRMTAAIINPNGSTGASVPSTTAFGKNWPGATGGVRDQPAGGPGAGGGGGSGAGLFTGTPRGGQPGGTPVAYLRLRSGPVPDGHVWPANPDWANPQ